MKQEKNTARKGHYITVNGASEEYYYLRPKEKMELWLELFRFRPYQRLWETPHINGKSNVQTSGYLREEVTYMADFQTNEKGEIEAVVFDKVSVEQRKGFL